MRCSEGHEPGGLVGDLGVQMPSWVVGDGQGCPGYGCAHLPRGLEQRSVLAHFQTSRIQPCGWECLGVVGPIPVPSQPPGSGMTTSPSSSEKKCPFPSSNFIKANILWASAVSPARAVASLPSWLGQHEPPALTWTWLSSLRFQLPGTRDLPRILPTHHTQHPNPD